MLYSSILYDKTVVRDRSNGSNYNKQWIHVVLPVVLYKVVLPLSLRMKPVDIL